MNKFLSEGSTLIVLSRKGKKVIVSGDFKEDDLLYVESLIDEFLKDEGSKKPQVKVNGKQYKSIAEASRETGIIFNTIKSRIKRGVEGYEFV